MQKKNKLLLKKTMYTLRLHGLLALGVLRNFETIGHCVCDQVNVRQEWKEPSWEVEEVVVV